MGSGGMGVVGVAEGWRGSVRNMSNSISYICSFINLASCSTIGSREFFE